MRGIGNEAQNVMSTQFWHEAGWSCISIYMAMLQSMLDDSYCYKDHKNIYFYRVAGTCFEARDILKLSVAIVAIWSATKLKKKLCNEKITNLTYIHERNQVSVSKHIQQLSAWE